MRFPHTNKSWFAMTNENKQSFRIGILGFWDFVIWVYGVCGKMVAGLILSSYYQWVIDVEGDFDILVSSMRGR